MIRKDRAFELDEEMKSEISDSTRASLNLTPSQNRIKISSAKTKRNLHITDFPSKYKNVEMNQKEKFLEINEKKSHYKRKFQEESSTLIEKKVEKRKRIFSAEKKSNIYQNNGSISKFNSSIHSKNTSNLLNYFSKATPEQLEKDRLKETTITIKAEIHDSQILQAPGFLDNQQEKNFKLKDASSKKLIEEYDEILLVQSETIVMSPSSPHDKKSDSFVPQSKPKWSLKIQLQSDDVQRSDIDDEIYMPTALSAQLKENVKNFKDIPKILLPLKNKKIGFNKTSLLIDENKKKSSKNLKSDIETVKTTIKKDKAVLMAKSGTSLNFEMKKKKDFRIESKIDSNSCITLDKKDIINKKSAGKLAPLFLKKIKPNAENMVAKHEFLQLDSNKYTDNTEKKNIELMVQQILPFSKISHVNQITSNVDEIEILNTYDKTRKFVEKKLFQPSIDYSTIKTISKLKAYNWISDEIYKPIKTDIDSALAQLKTDYSDIENLWEIISKFSKLKNFKAKGVKMKQKKIFKHLTNDPQSSCLWTDKYKPNKSCEVIGNKIAVSKLKTWLQNWQSLKTDENYSSSEEFCISDNNSSNEMITNKVAVLIGPHGSGKTASVYAVAQELGYMVLEVNASTRRPGKKILKDFEEATKSHRVKNFDIENFFAVPSSKLVEADHISKNSLILMEDIDLIFEQDDGFISATFQLASNTKRPIVMTLQNPCLHLAKMAPQQLQINFKPIDGRKVIALLQLIALAETGYQLSQNCIGAICQYGDLRKSLLQLQYLLISGGESILHNSLAVNDLLWSNMTTYIYEPALKADEMRRKGQYQKHEIINSLVENLDNFSLVSNLMNITDPTGIPINIKYEQSTSFIQNALPYSSLDDIGLEIGNWINNSVKNAVLSMCKKKAFDPKYTKENFKIPSKDEHVIHINSILSEISSSSLDHQSVTVDYLPTIRNICRAEKVRNELNNKRGNRFFHYLQNSRLLTRSKETCNIFSAACKMLQE